MRLIQVLKSQGAVLVFALVVPSTTLMAQKNGGSKPGPGVVPPARVNPSTSNTFPFSIPVNETCGDLGPCAKQKRLANEEPPCFKWPFSPMASSTVSVARMAVPAKAKKDFDDACGATANQSAKAEEHLRKATEFYPKYGDAWMLLGQLQLEQNKRVEAGESCQRALDADPEYLAAYVCLAMLAVNDEKWDAVSELTSRVLEHHPLIAPGAYYYNALANYHLHQFSPAEKSALRAVQDSGHDQQPEVHYLLARIFEAKNDRASEAGELRQYLKLSPHASDAALVKNILRQIDQQQTGSSAALNPKAAWESK
jgi:hypothetical protein